MEHKRCLKCRYLALLSGGPSDCSCCTVGGFSECSDSAIGRVGAESRFCRGEPVSYVREGSLVKLKADTPFGKLYAEPLTDTVYPGILVSLEKEEDGRKYLENVAIVESTPDHPAKGSASLRTLAYSLGREDYQQAQVFTTEASQQSQ